MATLSACRKPDMTALYSIQAHDGLTTMTFAPEKGGVGVSLTMPDEGMPEGKRELLYLPEGVTADNYEHICGGWPFCFPVCGRVNRDGKAQYLYNGQRYPMGLHGFAQHEPWQVLDHQADSITLQLTDNTRSRAIYPFAFDIRLTYRVEPGKLICDQIYHNPGEAPLYYAAGFHPYFSIPAEQYQKAEIKFVYHPEQGLKYNDVLNDLVGLEPVMETPIALNLPELNERLARVGENKTTALLFPDGRKIEMTAGPHKSDLFSYVHVYHEKDAPFFCIEPWTSHPNAINTMGGMRVLRSGDSDTAKLMLAYAFEH